MQRGILDTLEGTSFQLIVRPCDRSDPQFLASMRSFIEQQNLFGAILPPSVSEDQRLADILTAAGCPYVRIASVVLDEPAQHDQDARQRRRRRGRTPHRDVGSRRASRTFAARRRSAPRTSGCAASKRGSRSSA